MQFGVFVPFFGTVSENNVTRTQQVNRDLQRSGDNKGHGSLESPGQLMLWFYGKFTRDLPMVGTHLAVLDPLKKSLNGLFSLTKYVIPKSLSRLACLAK